MQNYNKLLEEEKVQWLFDNLSIKKVAPMLAKDYHKEKHKINWKSDVYVQPKLDGMRCLAILDGQGNVKLQSRDGKDIMTTGGKSMQHIVDELSIIKKKCILDGELYCHGKTFQENMKLIKKSRTQSIEIKYCVYDIIDNGPYVAREAVLCEKLDELNSDIVIQVYGRICKSEDELKIYHSNNISNEYEGTIIRHSTDGYHMKRSSNLLKYKDFIDVTAEIIDIEPAEARPDWGIPICRMIKEDQNIRVGTEFKCNTKMSHEDRKDLLSNKNNYIGKMAEVRFFELTDDGKPRFPVCVGIRIDK